MRILYHHRTLGDGAEGIHIREMVKAFRELGHEVKVIGPVGEALPEPSRKPTVLGRIKQRFPHYLFELLEIAYTGYCFVATAWAIRSFRPDFVYDRYMIFNAGAILAGMLSRVPVYLEVNAPLAEERRIEPDEQLSYHKIASRMERWICSKATRTFVVSTPLKQHLESKGVPRDQCILLPNGVDPHRFSPRSKNLGLLEVLGIQESQVVIGFAGILRGWHGLDLLVESVAQMIRKGLNVFLLIVGDGPYRERVEVSVDELGIKGSVAVTGRVPYEEVADYVSLFDIAVSPRATFYASPMKVIEYMALGKPVVVPNTLNFLDFVDDGLNGLTFENGSSRDLERALTGLCEAPATRRELGVRAREKVERRLNWRWNAEEVCRQFATQFESRSPGIL